MSDKLPVPTLEEFVQAGSEGREVVACSGARFGPLIALNIALRNGDTAILRLDTVGRYCLLSALKALIPDNESVRAAPAKEMRDGVAVQVGHVDR